MNFFRKGPNSNYFRLGRPYDRSFLKNDSSQMISSKGPAVVFGPFRPFHILLLAGITLGNGNDDRPGKFDGSSGAFCLSRRAYRRSKSLTEFSA